MDNSSLDKVYLVLVAVFLAIIILLFLVAPYLTNPTTILTVGFCGMAIMYLCIMAMIVISRKIK
jgi:hypothetical protein